MKINLCWLIEVCILLRIFGSTPIGYEDNFLQKFLLLKYCVFKIIAIQK